MKECTERNTSNNGKENEPLIPSIWYINGIPRPEIKTLQDALRASKEPDLQNKTTNLEN